MQQPLDRAVEFFQHGNLTEAERLCLNILAITPANFQVAHLLGVIRAQQGRSIEALELIGEALKINPYAAGALLNYGNVLKSLGRDQDALVYYDKTLAIKPNHAGALYNRGNVLLSLKRSEEALASYEKALAIQPDFVVALINYGTALHEMKRFEEALATYDKALAIKPGYPEVLNNCGVTLREIGRFEEALASYERALAIKPDYADALHNCGNVLRDLKRFDGALASYDKALTINPENAEVLNNRGTCLYNLKRVEEALASYDKALAIKPDFAGALHNRGNTLQDLKRFDKALTSYDKALAINPDNAELLNNRGDCLYYLKCVEEALASYDGALAIKPDYADALHSRGTIQWREGKLYEAAISDLEKVIVVDPDYDYAHGDLLHLKMHGTDWGTFEQLVALVDAGVRANKRIVDPFTYQAISASPADLQTCSSIFARQFYPPAPVFWKKADRKHKEIRVGYLSGEFREQATAYLTAGLYECHDKSKFEIVAFDNGPSTDSHMRRRLESSFDRFIRISALSDRAAAEKIFNEEIDILVSLNGYFGDHRMGVFAQKPAPIQVNYLGFPATLGASYIDYILADRFVIPHDEKQYYTEKVVYLPDSYQANDSKRHVAQSLLNRLDNQLPETGFVFCNFNVSYKLTPAMFAVWMRILRKVAGSVLWLLGSNTASPRNLRFEAERHGVAGDRLIFAPFIPMEKQLDRLKLADLFLDSLPYNAHTTASDALWAGVPLITCCGTSFPGRVATSLLHAIGLPELVTANLEEYEALAVKLANEPTFLQAIRQKLAYNRQTTPLFDTDRFRQHIEIAYTKMWETFQRGEAPQSFNVEPEC